MKMDNVTFVNMSSETKKMIANLSKSALRASAKVVRKKIRETVPLRSKNFKNHIASWVFINKQTGQPTLQVGFYGWQKVKQRKKTPSRANPHWIESGTKPHVINSQKTMAYNGTVYGKTVNHPGQQPTNTLRNAAFNNINEIRAAQEEYLAEINKTLDEAGVRVHTGEEEEQD